MTDLIDVELAVAEVEKAVTGVELAVSRVEQAVVNSASSWSSSFYSLIWIFAIGYGVPALIGNVWHSKWRYAAQYNISNDKVTVDKKPHDCEFFAAPIGNKYCEYKPSVTVVRWATSTTGMPIVSYDGGKTWSEFTPDASASVPRYARIKKVDVMWQKEEE